MEKYINMNNEHIARADSKISLTLTVNGIFLTMLMVLYGNIKDDGGVIKVAFCIMLIFTSITFIMGCFFICPKDNPKSKINFTGNIKYKGEMHTFYKDWLKYDMNDIIKRHSKKELLIKSICQTAYLANSRYFQAKIMILMTISSVILFTTLAIFITLR